MRTAIYIRVSTEEQAKEGYSISAQKQKLKAFCISQDWEVAGLYVDEGLSAKDMERPELQRMLENIKQRKIDCVLVYRLDRLTRSVLDLYKMLQVFDKYNCKFKSSTEVFDTTTAMGRMFITIVAAMAQWERENLGERVRMGTAEKVRQGKYAHNKALIGYDLDLATATLTINEEEEKIIRLIFDLYVKGYGANRICRYLNERNIPTKGGRTWRDNPLMKVLKNPVYMGSFKWGNILSEDSVPAIIDKEQFELVQSLIEKRKGLHPRQAASTYIFSGALKCRYCENPMVGCGAHQKNTAGEKVVYRYYRCLHKRTGQCDDGRSYSENKLEKAFISYIDKIDLKYEEEIAAAAEKELNKPKKKKPNNNDLILKQLEQIKNRRKKWQYAWANDKMSDEDYDSRMREERELEESLTAQLDEVEPEEIKTDKKEIYMILKDTKNNWNKLTKEEKKNFVQMFIKDLRIEHDDKNQIIIDAIDFY